MMKKIIPVALLASMMLGCGGGDDGGSSASASAPSSSSLNSYKTQLKIDAADLNHLQNVKYASNDGAGFETPENFQK